MRYNAQIWTKTNWSDSFSLNPPHPISTKAVELPIYKNIILIIIY